MKFASSIALLTLAASSAHAAVFYDAPKFAGAIIKASVSAGKSDMVYLRNKQTGQYLAYTRDNDLPDLTFQDEPYGVNLRDLGDNKYAFGFADDNYCLSSAWNFTLGLNLYSTLYRCCTTGTQCDNGSSEGPLRTAKQQMYMVPVDDTSLNTMVRAIVKSGIDILKRDSSLSSIAYDALEVAQVARRHLAKRMAKRDRNGRHAKRAGSSKGKRCEEHEEKKVAAKANVKTVSLAATKSKAEKEEGLIDTVHIIAVDHLHDMLTRSLSCKIITGAGNYQSVRLDVLDADDDCQQWDVIRASA